MMLNGLRTVTYTVDDLKRAKAWHADVLGTEPTFDAPYYVGFNVGGDELGLLPAVDRGPEEAGRTVAYWGVDDVEAAVERLQKKGATIRKEIQDIGEGIRLATMRTPVGTVLGVIENPNVDAE
jgi:predicted enzyme related to lactoylglutathione lyase